MECSLLLSGWSADGAGVQMGGGPVISTGPEPESVGNAEQGSAGCQQAGAILAVAACGGQRRQSIEAEEVTMRVAFLSMLAGASGLRSTA